MAQEPTLTLAPFYHGWAEYQGLLVAALRDLTPEQLALQATPGQRPIWLIAAHIIGTRIGWFRRMNEAADPALTPIDLWDEDGAPPRTAAELVHGFAATWAMLADCLDRWTPSMLDDEFTYQRFNGATVTRTRQWIIWHDIATQWHTARERAGAHLGA